jgi:hypothetical protein
VPAQLADVHIWRTQPWKNGAFVFYTARDVSPTPSDEHAGYMFLQKRVLGWQTKEAGAMVHPSSVAADGRVAYDVGGGGARNAGYALVFGRVLDPQVAVVEATFDTHQTLRDEPRDAMFAIIADGANAV